MSKLQRRLAAIMFTDIVGYSAMMQKDEVIANRKRKRHKTVFNELTPEFDGQILQYYGDGTLSIFNSTAAAVECAVEIQRALKKEPKVSLRIGIHTGDITLSDDDIFGDGVNIASRIESLCVPGGIYISSKVYDDIKNHSTLKAQYVGNFDLKNINDKTTVYAISNSGVTTPDVINNIEEKEPDKSTTSAPSVTGGKRKLVASILALAFGIFGAHRFYLGSKGLGIAYLTIALIGMFDGQGILIGGVAIVSFIDALLLFVSPQADFDLKYNSGIASTSRKAKKKKVSQVSKQKSLLKAKFERQKETAKTQFKNHEYQEAIQTLEEALEIKYDDTESHFLLAKGYSNLENAQKSLIHLDAAIAFGLDVRKAKFDHALAFLRIRPEYKVFVENNYRLLDNTFPQDDTTEPAYREEDLLSSSPELLDQLNKLEDLKNKGFLTEEEYAEQKKKLR